MSKPIVGGLPSSMFCSWSAVYADVASGRCPLVDLRSPSEFRRGSVPGAVNLPLLDDGERHRVGLSYKQEGQDEAVHLGLELFAAKAEAFFAELGQLASPAGDLLLYCWRGGMRSRLVALWLAAAGFRVRLLAGGYKAFRREVLSLLSELAKHRMLVLNGRTGVGKTDTLQVLSERGLPVIDFEGLAHHRGSAFGGLAQKEPSPTQQNFENKLAAAYLGVRPSPVIAVEIENFIGPVCLPPALRRALLSSPMVFLAREFDDRVERLSATYLAGWDEAACTQFASNMQFLQRFLDKKTHASILEAVAARRFSEAIAALLRLRYDQAYDKSLERHQAQAIASFNLTHAADKAHAFLEHYLRSGGAPSAELQ